MFKNDRHNGDGFGAAGSASEIDARIDVFLGRTSPVESQIFVRLRNPVGEEILEGFVRGPFCRYASTLPVNYPLRPSPDLLGDVMAWVVIPEPCFWTPDMPQTYELHLKFPQHATRPRVLGIRSLGARGRDLVFSGQRWVLRGVRSAAIESANLAEWREAGAAMVVNEPSDALCKEASHVGVVLVAMLPEDAPRPLETLWRLNRWPSVAVTAFGASTPTAAALDDDAGQAHVVPHQIMGTIIPQQVLADGAFSPPMALNVVLVEVDRPETFAESIANVSQPVIAMRTGAAGLSLAEARRACDTLQKDLAPGADCAGYVV